MNKLKGTKKLKCKLLIVTQGFKMGFQVIEYLPKVFVYIQKINISKYSNLKYRIKCDYVTDSLTCYHH